MNAFSGTWRLFKLAVRLDRIRLPIWILANVGIVFLTIPQLILAYSKPDQIIAYASATAPSAITRLLSGALTGPSIGEITIVETYILVLFLSVLCNIFLVVRHTRQNEETNRSELMGSMEVGRQASLTAALLLAFLVNIITGLLIFVAFMVNDLPLAGSAAYSIGIGLTGMLFAGITAVTSQLHQNARTASGLAGLIFGISFIIRGIGDALGKVRPDGLGVNTSLLSWFSPAAWTTNMRPFAGEKWWVLSFLVIAITLSISIAYALLHRRDVGAGLIAPRPGRVDAKTSLLRPFGLIRRLNNVAFISWWLSFLVFGATIGAVAKEFEALIAGNEEMQKVLSSIGTSADISDLMFGVTFTIAAIGIAAYAVQIITRIRKEETSGRLELVLSTSKKRQEWLAINFIYALLTATIILVSTGLVAGLAYGLTDGNLVGNTVRLGTAILVHLPSISIIIGVSLVLFSVIPRFFVSISWGLLAMCLLIAQIGSILNLPKWVIYLSPFSHTPAAPATVVNYTPLIIQGLIAAILIIIGFIIFNRRDIST